MDGLIKWGLIGVAAFFALQLYEDNRKHTPPQCPPGVEPEMQLQDYGMDSRPIYTGRCGPQPPPAMPAGWNKVGPLLDPRMPS